ncbi:hypothetical protein EZJ49_01830 [Bdellovibrio bacteriovorus]|uniref:hypothetical protein n=1 Tax=Bdellovibrio bacteriovorus TaxID=959 RepID=UPI0021D19F59|nr:hypothetical protein [Bdellovibrio bacteriovorus]UXR64988.1 hypothetical protein EZJ49_01830 [Bdellovibrio bacteriovorus]
MSKVGVIRVQGQDGRWAQQIVGEVQNWLAASGWGDVVTASFQPLATAKVQVEFVPGQFQSNSLRRISLRENARFSDFEAALDRWLWELE